MHFTLTLSDSSRFPARLLLYGQVSGKIITQYTPDTKLSNNTASLSVNAIYRPDYRNVYIISIVLQCSTRLGTNLEMRDYVSPGSLEDIFVTPVRVTLLYASGDCVVPPEEQDTEGQQCWVLVGALVAHDYK